MTLEGLHLCHQGGHHTLRGLSAGDTHHPSQGTLGAEEQAKPLRVGLCIVGWGKIGLRGGITPRGTGLGEQPASMPHLGRIC